MSRSDLLNDPLFKALAARLSATHESALPDYARERHDAERHAERTGRAFEPITNRDRYREEYDGGRGV